jgi:hypothetical protein
MLADVGSLSGADCGTARLKLTCLATHPRRGYADALRWRQRVSDVMASQPELLDVVFHVSTSYVELKRDRLMVLTETSAALPFGDPAYSG